MQVRFEEMAQKRFLSFAKAVQVQILKYVKKLESLENPKDMGKALSGNLKDYWRYRVGDYRLIAKLEKSFITIVDINHRSKIYKDK